MSARTDMTIRATCRSCGDRRLTTILELGVTPLANRLLSADKLGDTEPTFPLTLQFCSSCSLVQLREPIDPEVLFTEYLYFSSFSDPMVNHADTLAKELIQVQALGPARLVVEVASNAGYLLQHFPRLWVPALGIAPAPINAKVASDRGIPTLPRFFGEPLAGELIAEGRLADALIGINVLGHVDDLNGFVAAIKTVLKPAGIVVVEVPYVRRMVEGNDFDTIYHEHLHYFSITSLEYLFRRHGLTMVTAHELDIHGGSVRIQAMHSDRAGARPEVERFLEEEARCGMNGANYYKDFGKRAAGVRTSLHLMLTALKQEGRTIAAYGAAAKGITLLSYTGITAATLDFVVDRSPYKQNHFLPGLHLPILPPAALLSRRPDYLLLLTWNFAREILEQQRDYIAGGGRFIVPIPSPKVITP